MRKLLFTMLLLAATYASNGQTGALTIINNTD